MVGGGVEQVSIVPEENGKPAGSKGRRPRVE